MAKLKVGLFLPLSTFFSAQAPSGLHRRKQGLLTAPASGCTEARPSPLKPTTPTSRQCTCRRPAYPGRDAGRNSKISLSDWGMASSLTAFLKSRTAPSTYTCIARISKYRFHPTRTQISKGRVLGLQTRQYGSRRDTNAPVGVRLGSRKIFHPKS